MVNRMKPEISALMDSELGAAEFESTLAALREDREACAAWRTYHLIGDVLQGHAAPGARCVARVLERLASEPALIGALPADIVAAQRPRWYIPSAIAASLTAVALVGWMAFGPRSPDELVAGNTAPPKVVPVIVETPGAPAAKPVLVREPLSPSARDYLLAHQAYSPRNALQGVAPFVRSVSAEASRRP